MRKRVKSSERGFSISSFPEDAIVRRAVSGPDLAAVRELFEEYREYLGVDLRFQQFDEEVASLPGRYAFPEGCLYLLEVDGMPAGCVGLRPWEGTKCEMKRLYVREPYRGKGYAKLLVRQIMAYGKAQGYEEMVLDTLSSLHTALNLYYRMGFREIPSYYSNPFSGVIYLAVEL